MTADFHKSFDKQFVRLTEKQKGRVFDAIDRFLDNPNDPLLRNHRLVGEWTSFRSISAGGDIRLHFELLDSTTAYFVAVGTHAQLYR